MPSPLTERGLRRLAADPNRPREVADGSVPGLVARPSGAGVFTFSLRYRPAGERRRGGRQQRVTVGRWPEEPLATIRGRAVAELFFPSAAGTPFGVESWAHALARVVRATGAAPFTPHDLRRTPGVILEEAGFTPFDLSLVLGHSKAGDESAPRVTGIYLPSRFARRKRSVALAWDRLLRVILEGGDLAAACARERGEEGVELVRQPDQPAAQDARRR